MTITVVFDPPLPSDSPATFNTKAFTTLGDLNDWSTEANALAADVTAKQGTASTAATTATTQAGIATTGAGTATTQAGIAVAAAASINAIETTIHAATSKATPVDADEFGGTDSAASFGLVKFTWANIKATLLSTWKDATSGLVGLTLFKINFKNAGNTFTSFLTNANTAARTYTFPDKDITVAGLVDITGGTVAASFTDLTTTGNTVLGNATTDTLNVGNGGIIKDAGGNVGIGVAPAGSFNLAFPIGTNWYVGKHATTTHLAGNATRLDFGISDGSSVAGLSVRNTHDGTYSSQETFISVAYGGLRATSDIFKVDKSGNAMVIAPYGGLGYGAGAGNTTVQATSRTTSPAAINYPTGQITLVSAAGSTTPFSFTVNNSLVTANDRPQVVQKSGTDKYVIHVTNVGTGTFQITAWTTGGTTIEQPVFGFNIHKGSAS